MGVKSCPKCEKLFYARDSNGRKYCSNFCYRKHWFMTKSKTYIDKKQDCNSGGWS